MISTKSAARTDWVDYAKGLGIILVVYAHLLSSGYHAGLQIPEKFFALSDSIIYSFHMPLFFFLSGLFVETSFRKRGAKDFLVDKFKRMAYPYFVWSILQVGVEIVFSSQTQKGAGLNDLLAIPYRPWGQFWFLYALLFMNLVYVLVSPLGRLSMPVLFLVGAALFVFPPETGLFALFGFSGHFLFFVSGIYFGKWLPGHEDTAIWPVITVLLFLILIGGGYFLFTNVMEPVRLVGQSYPHYFLFLSVVGIIACIGLAQYLSDRGLLKFLAVLGAYSMPIFLAHMLVGVAARMALQIVGVQNWIVHILLGTVAALVIPVLLQKISILLKFPYLFELGRKDKTADDFPLRNERHADPIRNENA